jgi:hypothetical protein
MRPRAVGISGYRKMAKILTARIIGKTENNGGKRVRGKRPSTPIFGMRNPHAPGLSYWTQLVPWRELKNPAIGFDGKNDHHSGAVFRGALSSTSW